MPLGKRTGFTTSQSPRTSTQFVSGSEGPNQPASSVQISTPISAATSTLARNTASSMLWSSYGHQWFHSTGRRSDKSLRGAQNCRPTRASGIDVVSRSPSDPNARTTGGASTRSDGARTLVNPLSCRPPDSRWRSPDWSGSKRNTQLPDQATAPQSTAPSARTSAKNGCTSCEDRPRNVSSTRRPRSGSRTGSNSSPQLPVNDNSEQALESSPIAIESSR